jgi:long-chain fatty acid transport protein
MKRPNTALAYLIAVLSLLALLPAHTASAQGIALGGVGPVNRSMAGAATAAPIDAAGAIHWNPASISGLERSEMLFGLELLLPTENLSSSIEAGALGGGFPPVRLAGSTGGEPGVSPLPTVALVHKPKNSRWTYGLGIYLVGGFCVNYPASTTNPVLMPQNNTPGGFGGLGRLSAEAEYMQIVPTLSYALTERLSVGIAPTVTLGKISADPLFFATPDDAGGSLVPTYPPAGGTRYHWGGGFQVGAYYVTDTCWHLGLAFKSTQWFEDLRFKTTDEAGGPRNESVHFDYPMIISLGTAYSGIENWLFACDVRYFDYENTAGFGDAAGFDANGRVTGLGWQSVVSVHTGVQYRASQRVRLRLGYQYNDNPIRSNEVFFNVASPLIIQHVISTGLSYRLAENLSLSLAYLHGFENRSTGAIHAPGAGPIPGTSVSSRISADALSAGLTLQY